MDKGKTRIIFYSKGDNKFLDDIVGEISNNYEIRFVTIKSLQNMKPIDEGMEWADLCWFEWCDELIAYASKLEIAGKKKIICRLHSYEAFTRYPAYVNWSNVDKLIFVSKYIQRYVIENYGISEEKTVVIPNGVNLQNLGYKKRGKGFKVAYVGYINYKKGPMLLLQAFNAIYKSEKRYTFYIAGQYQDPRYLLYFNQMIRELGMESNFFFEGWQKDINAWLEDKNFIICSSVLESQNMSVMQAMAKGIKPVIHNFAGARDIYKSKYLWNTIDQAVEMVNNDDYDSEEYRLFVEENYSFNKHILKIEELIAQQLA